MQMMLITTLQKMVILVLLVAIVLTGVRLISRKTNYRLWNAKNFAAGVEAKAIVLMMEETGVYMNHQPLVKIQMQVLPEKGRNFVVEIKQVLSKDEMEALHRGSTVKVKYNPANLKETIVVNAA